MLQHSLFVPDDHLRSIQIEQLLEPVISVDQTTVEVVEITGGKVTTLEEYQRTKIWRNHRHSLEDHPLRFVAGIEDGFDDLQAPDQSHSLLLRTGILVLVLEFIKERVQLETSDHCTDRFRTHVGLELVAILLASEAVFLFTQQCLLLERSITRVDHDIVLVIDHPLQVSRFHVE